MILPFPVAMQVAFTMLQISKPDVNYYTLQGFLEVGYVHVAVHAQ